MSTVEVLTYGIITDLKEQKEIFINNSFSEAFDYEYSNQLFYKEIAESFFDHIDKSILEIVVQKAPCAIHKEVPLTAKARLFRSEFNPDDVGIKISSETLGAALAKELNKGLMGLKEAGVNGISLYLIQFMKHISEFSDTPKENYKEIGTIDPITFLPSPNKCYGIVKNAVKLRYAEF